MADGAARAVRAATLFVCCVQVVHAGCLQPTPFSTDVSEDDAYTLAKNLERLSARGPVAPPFAFVALGDTHDDYDDLEDVVAVLRERSDVHFLVHSGDLTNRGLLAEFAWVKHELDELDVPYLTTLGNHDALSRGQQIYREMFGPYDYSFVYGGVKLVFYNANTLEFPGEAPRRDWLRAQVSDLGGAERLMLVGHVPPQSSEDLPGGDTRRFYEEIATEHDIALWIHGHIADYALVPFHDDLALSTSTFEGGHYSVVTVLEGTLRVERCTFAVCNEVTSPYGPVDPAAVP